MATTAQDVETEVRSALEWHAPFANYFDRFEVVWDRDHTQEWALFVKATLIDSTDEETSNRLRHELREVAWAHAPLNATFVYVTLSTREEENES